MKLRGLLPLMLLLGSVALAARAQVCSPESPLRRTLPVNVLDAQGNVVRGLTAGDFRASFRGRPIKVVSAQLDSNPRRIVVLLDISDSMTMVEPKWALAREAVQRMVSQIPPGASLALVLFGSQVAYKVEFAQGRDAVLEALGALRQESRAAEGYRLTALFDSAVEALAMFDPAGPGDAIYAVTDGGEGKSKNKSEQVEKAFLGSGVRLFVFLLREPTGELWMAGAFAPGPGGGPAADDRAAQVLKQRPWEIQPEGFGSIAQTTGGRALTVYFDSPGATHPWRHWVKENQTAGVDFGIRLLGRQMADFYLLEFDFPWELKETQNWNLEVVDAKGKRRKDLDVVYPRKLAPCGVSPPPGP